MGEKRRVVGYPSPQKAKNQHSKVSVLCFSWALPKPTRGFAPGPHRLLKKAGENFILGWALPNPPGALPLDPLLFKDILTSDNIFLRAAARIKSIISAASPGKLYKSEKSVSSGRAFRSGTR